MVVVPTNAYAGDPHANLGGLTWRRQVIRQPPKQTLLADPL